MANVLNPFGFADFGMISGADPTFGQTTGVVSKLDTTPLFKGDVLSRLTTGYITRATPGTAQIHGIFIGCSYLSISQGKVIQSNYYPGSDAQTDVTALIISNPAAVFYAQCNAGPILFSDVGANINFANGTGNTFTQLSGATLDYSTVGTTTTLPFRITGVYSNPVGQNGTDGTTPFNYAYVTFNNQDFKSLTGV